MWDGANLVSSTLADAPFTDILIDSLFVAFYTYQYRNGFVSTLIDKPFQQDHNRLPHFVSTLIDKPLMQDHNRLPYFVSTLIDKPLQQDHIRLPHFVSTLIETSFISVIIDYHPLPVP